MQKLFFFLVCFGASGLLMYVGAMAFLDPHPLLGFFVTVCSVALITGGLGMLYPKIPVTKTHKRIGAGLLSAILVGVLMINWFSGSRTMSDAAQADAKRACASYINRHYNEGRMSNPAFALDAWEKRGSIVVAVGWDENQGTQRYRSRLCVFRPESGELWSPGAFDRNRWERW